MNTFFEEITAEFGQAIIEKGHPFRFFSLATIGLDNTIGLRTIVLRDVSPKLQLTFYTDRRSPKIAQLQKDTTVSALFYHPQKMLQLRMYGKAIIEEDSETLKTFWENVPTNAQKDYITSKPPGDKIKTLDEVQYLTEKNHFSVVHIIPNQMDFLKLGLHYHTRVQFSLEGEEWKGKFSVP